MNSMSCVDAGRHGGIVGCVCMIAVLVLAALVSAITRDRIMSTVQTCFDVSYSVDSLNVFPWNTSDCYDSTCIHTMGLGSQRGEAYSWGNWHTVPSFLTCLDDEKGAGNGDCMGYSCYSQNMCGIDCSGLVGRAWELPPPKPGTYGLVNQSGAIDKSWLQRGAYSAESEQLFRFI